MHLARLTVAILAAVLALPSVESATYASTSRNCRCLCSDSEGQNAEHLWFAVGDDSSKCTADRCRATFSSCLDEGSHNENAIIQATYGDCSCKCNFPGESPRDFPLDLAGQRDECTPAKCSVSFSSCPDDGSHNDGSFIAASFIPAPPDSPADTVLPSAPVSDMLPVMRSNNLDDCVCECCEPDQCPQTTRATFKAVSPDGCTADHCRAKFSFCPDLGSHNEDAEVAATFNDCTCGCCDSESDCPADHSTLRYYLSSVGSQASCHVGYCASNFLQCRGAGEAGGVAIATWNGPIPIDEPEEEETLVLSEKELEVRIQEERTEAAQPWVIILVVVLVLVLGIVLVLIRMRSKGFKWVNMEDLNDIPDDPNSNGSSKVSSANNA